MTPLRIVSLLPSATEIIHLLGLTEHQVGRSHECDYPAGVEALPACTAPKFNPEGSSADIHARVTDILQAALSVYQVKTDLLQQLKPTHILTQDQCEVCAVSLPDVKAAVESLTGVAPQIISLQPTILTEVLDDIHRVAKGLLGDTGQAPAEEAIAALKARLATTRKLTQDLLYKPSVVCLEWLDPLMAAGNWIPELVALAGGLPKLGVTGQHSPWITWNELAKVDPDVIILMPCGYDIAKTVQESTALVNTPNWSLLRAVKTGRVYVVDGNQYFNRPGPRLVNSVEILIEILHPTVVAPQFKDLAWRALN